MFLSYFFLPELSGIIQNTAMLEEFKTNATAFNETALYWYKNDNIILNNGTVLTYGVLSVSTKQLRIKLLFRYCI